MAAHGSATAEASVMGPALAPSPFAGKLPVVGGALGAVLAVNALMASGAVGAVLALNAVMASGAVGAVMAVGSGGGAGGAVGGGAVGGGAVACSPTVSQEEEEVVWAGRGACPHDSRALARCAVPATASGPFAHLLRYLTLGSCGGSLTLGSCEGPLTSRCWS